MWQCPYCKEWFNTKGDSIVHRRYTSVIFEVAHILDACKSPKVDGIRAWENTFRYLR